MGLTSTGATYIWPNNLVPYTIDPALTYPQRVMDAIAHWEANTPIRFIRRDTTNEDLLPNYVIFQYASSGCSSSVGRRGGAQYTRLSASCSLGNTIHEIGHVVGLWHEHTRLDRDNYISINWDNIAPDAKDNFEQNIDETDDRGAYDYGSIMHYPAYAFAIDSGVKTITTLNGAAIGQRTGLSAGDISAVKALYGFTWAQGTNSVNMGPIADRFCFLTAMSGAFAGYGEYISVSQSNGNWHLSGGSLQVGVSGGAACRSSSKVTSEYSWSQGQLPTNLGSATGRVCFLTHVSGSFDGGAEFVHVYSNNGMWYLGGNSMQTGISARARCVAVSGYSNEYTWEQGAGPTYMDWAGRYSCALTRVQGSFKGGGESVKASVEGGRWILGGSSLQVGVGGRARCFRP
nr:M12 family metallopeptidase [Pyxidicoccus fallax]